MTTTYGPGMSWIFTKPFRRGWIAILNSSAKAAATRTHGRRNMNSNGWTSPRHGFLFRSSPMPRTMRRGTLPIPAAGRASLGWTSAGGATCSSSGFWKRWATCSGLGKSSSAGGRPSQNRMRCLMMSSPGTTWPAAAWTRRAWARSRLKTRAAPRRILRRGRAVHGDKQAGLGDARQTGVRGAQDAHPHGRTGAPGRPPQAEEGERADGNAPVRRGLGFGRARRPDMGLFPCRLRVEFPRIRVWLYPGGQCAGRLLWDGR